MPRHQPAVNPKKVGAGTGRVKEVGVVGGMGVLHVDNATACWLVNSCAHWRHDGMHATASMHTIMPDERFPMWEQTHQPVGNTTIIPHPWTCL